MITPIHAFALIMIIMISSVVTSVPASCPAGASEVVARVFSECGYKGTVGNINHREINKILSRNELFHSSNTAFKSVQIYRQGLALNFEGA